MALLVHQLSKSARFNQSLAPSTQIPLTRQQCTDVDVVDPVAELRELTKSAGAKVCGEMIVSRNKPVAATYIGKGISEELALLVKEHEADVVIFDHAITPVQERNLEKILHCRVLDRAGLILDIFAQRATSSEGKLQVELAQLKHLSTRLVRGWSHLERQKGGIGLRGPGESQLETDRRLIGVRIKTLSKRLEKVESQRLLRRRSRHRTPIPTVSLVGYTNAGKSSLFNRLTGASVLAEDRLFATLDPTMRRLDLPGFGPIVLSDTVGFIRQLPHSLIAAFHSTLEEVVSATCLLIVHDASDQEADLLTAEVHHVLDEIGAGKVPKITVHNKIDVSHEPAQSRVNSDGVFDKVWVSAETGEGLDLLEQALAGLLGQFHQLYTLHLLPYASELRAKLYQRCEVVTEQIRDDGVMILEVKMDQADKGWLDSQRQFSGHWLNTSEHSDKLLKTA